MSNNSNSSLKFPYGPFPPAMFRHNNGTCDATCDAAIATVVSLPIVFLLCAAYCMLPTEKRAAISSTFHNCAERVSECKERLKGNITNLASNCCSMFRGTSAATKGEEKPLVPEVKSN